MSQSLFNQGYDFMMVFLGLMVESIPIVIIGVVDNYNLTAKFAFKKIG